MPVSRVGTIPMAVRRILAILYLSALFQGACKNIETYNSAIPYSQAWWETTFVKCFLKDPSLCPEVPIEPDLISPTILSITPANLATGVDPIYGKIVIVFSEPMQNLTSHTFATSNFDGTSNVSLDSTGTNFVWTSQTTLEIRLSWIYFPENSEIYWDLAANNLVDLSGNIITTALSGSFTTTIDSGVAPFDFASVLPIPDPTYTDDYITLDTNNGLIWKTCTEGLSDPSCATGAGSEPELTWQQGVNACAYLNQANSGNGYASRKDWRRPSQAELSTLLDSSYASPAINPNAFPGTPVNGFWSATTLSGTPASSEYVNFVGSGSLGNYPKSVQGNIRCVAGP